MTMDLDGKSAANARVNMVLRNSTEKGVASYAVEVAACNASCNFVPTGPDDYSDELGHYCGFGAWNVPDLYSSGGYMTIRFYTDYYWERLGFEAQVTACM